MCVRCRHGAILPERPDFLRVTAKPAKAHLIGGSEISWST
jgi:hypothetical protein